MTNSRKDGEGKNFFDLTDKEKKILVERAAKESSADQVRKYGTPNLLTLGREKKPKVDKAFQVFIIEHDNAVIKEYREKLRKKIERKEKKKIKEFDPYCKVCGHCGCIECDGVENFLNEHVKGKTNCLYEEEIIKQIISLFNEQ